jgi:predicted glycosyltransferase
MTARALLYVQHLLGIGHLARIHRIAAGLAAAGVRATIVQGGADAGLDAPEGVDLVRLAPVRAAASDMAALVHADGRPFSEADALARRDHLIAAVRRLRPDILVVEAFPFGRRQMRFELIPLLEAARGLGVRVIASSIRDILQESRKPGRAEETRALVERHFDLVLVHGDEALTPLSATFPLAGAIAARTRYTGLVGPQPPKTADRRHAVVVSAGGGGVGLRLLEAAVAAAPLTPLAHEDWLVLAGPNLPDADFARLSMRAAAMQGAAMQAAATEGAGPRLTVMRSTPDLAARLAGAKLSISQAGYNTVADIMVAGCPAVLVPYAEGGETEQTARARALAQAGRAAVLPPARPLTLDGGARTARLLLDALRAADGGGRRIESAAALMSSVAEERR